jgi:hypothetical protein
MNLKDLLLRRTLQRVTSKEEPQKEAAERRPKRKRAPKRPKETAIAPKEPLPPAVMDFLKAEINLEAIGFFSAFRKRDVGKKKEKVISFKKKEIDGKTIEVKCHIIPSAKYGYPIILDLDMYRGFQKLLTDILKAEGAVPKHITFTSADLIRAMGKEKRHGGEFYQEIADWLMRMALTGIKSQGAVYHAGKKTYIKDLVKVFDRVVQYGKELDDGSIADRHHVWLSDWYLENINRFRVRPLEYNLHKALRRPIAKGLLPLLEEGFYAGEGKFHKRYDELCMFLGITRHRALSLIKQQLDPAHRELQAQRFLKEWSYKRSSDEKSYIITWIAGERYWEEQEKQEELRISLPRPQPSEEEEQELLFERIRALGVGESDARELSRKLDEVTIKQWEEVAPYLHKARDKGAYIALALKEGYPIPEYALKAKREAQMKERRRREEEERRRQEEEARERERQRRERLMAYYESLSPEERKEIDRQAMASIGDFAKKHAQKLEAEGEDPLSSIAIRSVFEGRRFKILEEKQGKEQQEPEG